MKNIITISIIVCMGLTTLYAQTNPPDSVVINVGHASKITVVIRDKKDLETLKSYNFQSLMNDLITKLETKDTASAMKPSQSYLNDSNGSNPVTIKKDEDENWKKTESLESADQKDGDVITKDIKMYRGTRHSLSFDFGTNNYLTKGSFPDASTDLYATRPWGSWYAAINSVYRTRLSRVFFFEWGFGGSMYNFKFQNDAVTVSSDPSTVNFTVDSRPGVDFIKSKLSVTYLNASFIPVIDFGGNSRKPVLFDGRRSDSFRVGFGPYAGYRIDSYSRKVFENEDGDKRKERDHDTFHLNNFRYGLRLQLGFKDTDLFFNYDLNSLFAQNKGPDLNAFSFGISF